MTPPSLRELNRATLARQLLLERVRLDVPEAVHRLGALQAQRPRAHATSHSRRGWRASLSEPLDATALRPILAELEREIADRVWRRVRTNAPIQHVPGDEPHAFGHRNRFVAATAWLGALEAEEGDGSGGSSAATSPRSAPRAAPTPPRSPASRLRRSLPRSRRWRRKRDIATPEAMPFVEMTKAQRDELERKAALALGALEPQAARFEVEFVE